MHVNAIPFADTAFADSHTDPTGHSLCWYAGEPTAHCNRRADIHFLAEVPHRNDVAGEAMSCTEHFMDAGTSTNPNSVTPARVIAQHPYDPRCRTGFDYNATTDVWDCDGSP